MGDGARTLGEIGDDLVHRPGVLPGKAHGWFRTWFGRVWQVRGGGLYALGYAVAFVWLEVTTILDDVLGAESVIGFFTAEIVEFLFRFLSESLLNFLLALLWPVYVLQFAPPWGVLALVAAYLAFPYLVKKPIERWLFGTVRPADDSEAGTP